MSKSTSGTQTPLRDQLDRLAAFPPVDAPVLSLYLDMRPNQHGRDQYDSFLRKTFMERARTLDGAAKQSFERDAARIFDYLGTEARTSANGLAIFACSAAGDFFEVAQLDVPIESHWLFIGSVPHLYPLARINDQYPRYAALLVDTNSARLFVFSLGRTEQERRVDSVKTKKTSIGGMSQARYQRHNENFHLLHMKEVVDVLDRVVRDEAISQIIVSCDEVAKPTLMAQLPKHLADKLVDIVRLDVNTPEHEVLARTFEALREKDAGSDAGRVAALLDAWRAQGLGVVGPEDTLEALTLGQVDELLITTTPALLKRIRTAGQSNPAPGPIEVDTSAPATGLDPHQLKLAGELVTKAQQTGARLRFIEDGSLLAAVGGVGALLRFKA